MTSTGRHFFFVPVEWRLMTCASRGLYARLRCGQNLKTSSICSCTNSASSSRTSNSPPVLGIRGGADRPSLVRRQSADYYRFAAMPQLANPMGQRRVQMHCMPREPIKQREGQLSRFQRSKLGVILQNLLHIDHRFQDRRMLVYVALTRGTRCLSHPAIFEREVHPKVIRHFPKCGCDQGIGGQQQFVHNLDELSVDFIHRVETQQELTTNFHLDRAPFE